jgi:hypothetical protein
VLHTWGSALTHHPHVRVVRRLPPRAVAHSHSCGRRQASNNPKRQQSLRGLCQVGKSRIFGPLGSSYPSVRPCFRLPFETAA